MADDHHAHRGSPAFNDGGLDGFGDDLDLTVNQQSALGDDALAGLADRELSSPSTEAVLKRGKASCGVPIAVRLGQGSRPTYTSHRMVALATRTPSLNSTTPAPNDVTVTLMLENGTRSEALGCDHSDFGPKETLAVGRHDECGLREGVAPRANSPWHDIGRVISEGTIVQSVRTAIPADFKGETA